MRFLLHYIYAIAIVISYFSDQDFKLEELPCWFAKKKKKKSLVSAAKVINLEIEYIIISQSQGPFFCRTTFIFVLQHECMI